MNAVFLNDIFNDKLISWKQQNVCGDLSKIITLRKKSDDRYFANSHILRSIFFFKLSVKYRLFAIEFWVIQLRWKQAGFL